MARRAACPASAGRRPRAATRSIPARGSASASTARSATLLTPCPAFDCEQRCPGRGAADHDPVRQEPREHRAVRRGPRLRGQPRLHEPVRRGGVARRARPTRACRRRRARTSTPTASTTSSSAPRTACSAPAGARPRVSGRRGLRGRDLPRGDARQAVRRRGAVPRGRPLLARLLRATGRSAARGREGRRVHRRHRTARRASATPTVAGAATARATRPPAPAPTAAPAAVAGRAPRAARGAARRVVCAAAEYGDACREQQRVRLRAVRVLRLPGPALLQRRARRSLPRRRGLPCAVRASHIGGAGVDSVQRCQDGAIGARCAHDAHCDGGACVSGTCARARRARRELQPPAALPERLLRQRRVHHRRDRAPSASPSVSGRRPVPDRVHLRLGRVQRRQRRQPVHDRRRLQHGVLHRLALLGRRARRDLLRARELRRGARVRARHVQRGRDRRPVRARRALQEPHVRRSGGRRAGLLRPGAVRPAVRAGRGHASTQYCLTGACTSGRAGAPCTADRHCDMGTCQDGACVQDGLGAACEDNSALRFDDLRGQYRCADGNRGLALRRRRPTATVAPSATSASARTARSAAPAPMQTDCSSGYCGNYFCTDGSLGSSCNGDEDCASGACDLFSEPVHRGRQGARRGVREPGRMHARGFAT